MKTIRTCAMLAACLLEAALPLDPAIAGKVNINTADAETIAAGLHGIGPVKAKAIIEYREENGPFKSVEELLNVKGIGPKTLEKIHKDVVLEGEPETMTGQPRWIDAGANQFQGVAV